MNGPHYQRGVMLYEQSRHDLAEQEFRLALGENPDDPLAHAMLALCLSHRKEFKAATEEAQAAIHRAPDLGFGHYALASILYDRNRFDEAIDSIDEAIRLEPEDADFWALKSNLHLANRVWPAALEAAERGLQIDPEHATCANLRAIALVNLGRKSEAGATIDASLSKNPENSLTHANQGWTLLHQGQTEKAMEHFREALRLEPDNEWARQGIVEALKARHFLYGIMLKYSFWMSRLSGRAQWGIILGGFFGARILRGLAADNPALKPIVYPVIILYVIFALSTWIADPLFNLVLRLNRFGRLVLSREQIVASNWIGGCLGAALLMLALALLTGAGEALFAAMVFGFLVIPLAGTFGCLPGWPRSMMAAYTCGLAAIGLSAVALISFQESSEAGIGPTLIGLFFIGAILSGWVANALRMARPKF